MSLYYSFVLNSDIRPLHYALISFKLFQGCVQIRATPQFCFHFANWIPALRRSRRNGWPYHNP